MAAADPTEPNKNNGAGHSASVDEAPVFTTREHLEYLVGLIIKEWKKTMVKWHNASADTVTWHGINEQVFYNPSDDSVIKFCVDDVPGVIHDKVNALQHMQRIGLPNLPALVELAKEELAKDPFSTEQDESGDDNETSFTGMLMELAKNRLFTEYVEREETGFNLTVVFVDESGKMRLKQCRLQDDTDFVSFLAIMDDYPHEFDLNVDWAASWWDEKIRELKEKGYDGHPKLLDVEQLIATHKATNYDESPKWVFFKTNQRVAYAKPIEKEDDFKKILDIVTNTAKENRLACMVRTVDKDLIFISDELKFFESRLEDSVPPSDEAASQLTQDNSGDQQPNDERAPGIESFTVDDLSLDLLARSLDIGFNWAFLRDGDGDDDQDEDKDEEEEQDRLLPWSLTKSIDKS